MIRRYAPATILLFSLLLTNGNCEDASDKSFKMECFSETEGGNENEAFVCQDSRINIKGTFYKCESAVRFKTSIKRIGFLQDDILVLAGKQNYVVDESKQPSEARPVRRISPLISQLLDRKGNIYYGGNNVVYVQRQQDNGLLEVITHNAVDSHNAIAIDEMSDNFFILSRYEDDSTSQIKNSLYFLPISSVNTSNDTISAEEYAGLKGVTAIGFNSFNNFLYLGLELSNGEGKLIKLKGQFVDPCSVGESYKQEITDAISEFREKLFDVLDKSATSIQTRESNDDIVLKDSDKVLSLTWEKEELERQLNATSLQLETLRRIYSTRPIIAGPNFMTSNFQGDIEERMSSTPKVTPNNNEYSINILISPPVQLPSNASGPTPFFYPPISINIIPTNNGNNLPVNFNPPGLIQPSMRASFDDKNNSTTTVGSSPRDTNSNSTDYNFDDDI